MDDRPSAPARNADDRGYRQRNRGIYVLAGICVAFFVVVFSACYIAAVGYVYGTDWATVRSFPSAFRRWEAPAFGVTSDYSPVLSRSICSFSSSGISQRAGWNRQA